MNLTPNASAAHWSAQYVGLPWRPGADGPDAFDCWGLVRHVQRVHYGRKLPKLAVDVREAAPPSQWVELRTLVQRSPWRPITTGYADGDLLVMLNARGLPHIGTVVALERLYVLHATGEVDERGVEHGNVSLEPIADLGASGFGHIEAWRFTP